DTDRVLEGQVVDRSELNGLGGALDENELPERRLVLARDSLLVFEDAVDLDLNPALFQVFHVGHDFETAIRQNPLLQAGAPDGDLCELVELHEFARAFDGVFRRVQLLIGPRIGGAAGKKRGGQREAAEKIAVVVHKSKQAGSGKHLVDQPGNRDNRKSEGDWCFHDCCWAKGRHDARNKVSSIGGSACSASFEIPMQEKVRGKILAFASSPNRAAGNDYGRFGPGLRFRRARDWLRTPPPDSLRASPPAGGAAFRPKKRPGRLRCGCAA